MKVKNLLLLTLSFCFYFSFSQDKSEKDSVYATKITLYNTKYREFEIINNSVYTLTVGDSLIKINLSDNSFTLLRTDIKNIAKTKQNKIVALTHNGNVIQQINGNNFVIKDTFKGNPHKILVDKNDNFVIVTTKYVRYKNENFIPGKNSPMYRKAGRYGGKKSLIPIDVYYIDNQDRIWFGYDAGEWGGDICSFDLNTKKFIDDRGLYDYIYNTTENKKKENYSVKRHAFDYNPNIIKVIDNDTIMQLPYDMGYSNVKGITQNEKGDYYIALSLMHFFVESNLYKRIQTSEKNYYKKVDITDILEHKIYEAKTEEYIDNEGNIKTLNLNEWKESLEYLGGIAYNPFDKHVYYYTNNGFWKIIENENNYSKEFIFRPWIYWTAGLPDAVGYQMNVVKFEFKSEKELIFLTTNNGIGYFNGKSVIYYK